MGSIQVCMTQDPSTKDYRPYPKGPNFLAIVIGFCVAILVIAIVALLLIHGAGKKIFPMKTKETPSQTLLRNPIKFYRAQSRELWS